MHFIYHHKISSLSHCIHSILQLLLLTLIVDLFFLFFGYFISPFVVTPQQTPYPILLPSASTRELTHSTMHTCHTVQAFS